MGSIPGWGTKIPQAAWSSQKKRERESRGAPVEHLKESGIRASLAGPVLCAWGQSEIAGSPFYG